MPNQPGRIIAVYPGSFDPVTFGHLDIIRRSARLFGEVICGIGINPKKEELFSPDERLALLEPHLAEFGNVRAAKYHSLTIDFCRQVGGSVLLRGIRDVNDLSHELRQANVNMMIGGVETIFMLTSDQNVLTSSTYLKQIYEMSGGENAPIHRLVPENVVAALSQKLGQA